MDENTRSCSGLTKYLWLLPALVVLLLIARAAISLSGSATDGATWDADGQVLEVDEGGPAAQAGLRVGDTVLSAGNCDTATWDVCQYNAYCPGSVVPITFQQGEQVHAASLTLTMTPAGTRLAWLMVLLVALAFCLCSLVVVMSRPDATEARLFYALGQVEAASLVMGTSGRRFTPRPGCW
jgi:membrane-associated protease RseP (regulator of RpoE activity)